MHSEPSRDGTGTGAKLRTASGSIPPDMGSSMVNLEEDGRYHGREDIPVDLGWQKAFVAHRSFVFFTLTRYSNHGSYLTWLGTPVYRTRISLSRDKHLDMPSLIVAIRHFQVLRPGKTDNQCNSLKWLGGPGFLAFRRHKDVPPCPRLIKGVPHILGGISNQGCPQSGGKEWIENRNMS